MFWDVLSAWSTIRKVRPVLRLQTGMPFPERLSRGKHVPFFSTILGRRFRLAPQGESASHFARRTGALLPPTASPIDISPDKTCQNKPVPFWQVLEADGEGDLMVVAGYSSGASMGLGDSAYDG